MPALEGRRGRKVRTSRTPAARSSAAWVALVLIAAACGSQTVPGSARPMPSSGAPVADGSVPGATAAITVEPAPGSNSAVYAPNPDAIVVAIDPGHGGCLDWGVPDPSERGVDLAEKTLTLAIARRLAARLEAAGVHAILIRDSDEALAGDDYAALGCAGRAWRDVDGDGMAGFGPDVPEATRTRDELQARLDLANVAMADAMVSIHINSPFDAGQPVEIAFTETFYTDETPWGASASADLAAAVQAGVVAGLEPLANYGRGDRGITAHNFYLVAPPLFEPTEERPDPLRQPARGGLMPVVLSEVGSMTLRSEHDLLASPEGQTAVAAGMFDGLAAFFAGRELSARIGLAGGTPGQRPQPVAGDGPPFWPPVVPSGPLRLRLTNSGSLAWPPGIELLAGWEESDQPYLARAPGELERVAGDLPSLGPGESAVLDIELPPAPDGRALAWISMRGDGWSMSEHGSPPLQLSSSAP